MKFPPPTLPLAESFFASIKGELLDLQSWPTHALARRAVVEYIGWYNGTRLHSTLGYLSPQSGRSALTVAGCLGRPPPVSVCCGYWALGGGCR